MQDPFDEIASGLLISDAELALTFIHIGTLRPEGAEKRMAFRRAAHAYASICNSICCIRMNGSDLARLGTLLEQIKARLSEATVHDIF